VDKIEPIYFLNSNVFLIDEVLKKKNCKTEFHFYNHHHIQTFRNIKYKIL